MNENELWILSYYRVSEIGGAMFFAGLTRRLPPGAIQCDMTRHFADEAQHASLWTKCIQELDAEPLKLGGTYQDQYLAATGMPANLMEVLAITQVFEQRVLQQYSRHLARQTAPAAVRQTIQAIMNDEKWHIFWVHRELVRMEERYGRDEIRKTLERMRGADEEVYGKMLKEHTERAAYMLAS